MTPNQVKLVQESFSKVVPISSQAAEIFYSTLFEMEPSVRSMFKGNMKEQQFKLMASLQMIVIGLEKPKIMLEELKGLAIRHAYYGVKNEHYPIVGKALIETLRKGLGDAFTPDVEKAWIESYTMISSVMIKAAEEA